MAPHMQITKIETNKNKSLYFNETTIKPKKYSKWIDRLVVNIYPDMQYQEFLGFGACITESSAYNYSLLPEEKKIIVIQILKK